jgi:hypothetical protein
MIKNKIINNSKIYWVFQWGFFWKISSPYNDANLPNFFRKVFQNHNKFRMCNVFELNLFSNQFTHNDSLIQKLQQI